MELIEHNTLCVWNAMENHASEIEEEALEELLKHDKTYQRRMQGPRKIGCLLGIIGFGIGFATHLLVYF